jgi:hypothetical protein
MTSYRCTVLNNTFVCSSPSNLKTSIVGTVSMLRNEYESGNPYCKKAVSLIKAQMRTMRLVLRDFIKQSPVGSDDYETFLGCQILIGIIEQIILQTEKVLVPSKEPCLNPKHNEPWLKF